MEYRLFGLLKLTPYWFSHVLIQFLPNLSFSFSGIGFWTSYSV